MLIKNVILLGETFGLLGAVSLGLLALSGCVVEPGEGVAVVPVPVIVGPAIIVPVEEGPRYAPRGYYRR